MKKTFFKISLLLIISFNLYADEKPDNFKNDFNTVNNSEKQYCYENAYKLTTEINQILDKKISKPEDSLFNKIKTSNLWKSLNKENQEQLAINVMRWTLEGEDKVSSVKLKIASYYLEKCNNLK